MAKRKAAAEEDILRADVAVAEEPQVAAALNNFDRIRGLVGSTNKHYKKNVLKSGESIRNVQKVQLGEPQLDYVHDGGIPISRMTEYLGQEHSGKTRNALVALVRFQHYCFNCNGQNTLTAVWKAESAKAAKDKGVPVLESCSCTNCDSPRTTVQAFVDYEGTADKLYMKRMGLDLGGLIFTQPDLPSTAVDVVDALLRNPEVGLIVFDSVGSMSSDSEVEKAQVDIKMNQNAMFLNRATRKWQASMNANVQEDNVSPTSLIVINQSYTTLDGYGAEVAQGGRGLRHGKGLSIKSRIAEKVYKGSDRQEIAGVHVKLENLKNKTGMPYRKGAYYLNLDEQAPDMSYCGPDLVMQAVELGITLGLITTRGAWTYYEHEGVEHKWNGKAKMIEDMRDNQEAVDVIMAGIYSFFSVDE